MNRDSTAMAPSLNRHADFNWLWLGQSVSSFGTQISMLAIPLTAVLYLHADAAQLGLLSACERFAFIAPLLYIGVWVDRHARALQRYGYGPFLVGAYLVGMTAIVTIPIIGGHGLTATALFSAATFVSGVAVIGTNIAETTLVQLIVPRHLQGRVRASLHFALGACCPSPRWSPACSGLPSGCARRWPSPLR